MSEKRSEAGFGPSSDIKNPALYDVETTDNNSALHDAVFGEITSDGPNYRAVGSVGAFVLMSKANLGLGILGVPFTFQVLGTDPLTSPGLIPGIIVIVVLGLIVGYCATQIQSFKLLHPEAYGLADAAYIVGGRVYYEFVYIMFWLNMVTVFSAAISSVATALNAISVHGACTAIFMAVAAAGGMMLGSIQTLHRITFIGWAGLVSLIISVLILVIAVGIQDRPASAPQVGPWDKEFKLFNHPTFAEGMSAVNNIMFSLGATATYFNVVSEMRDPRKYKKAVVISISSLTVLYLIIGSIVYHFCGKYVSSPALGSAGPLLKKVCYGMALPALIASLCMFAHLPAKHMFVRILAGSKHLSSNSMTHWVTWIGCIVFSGGVGYIVASAIPTFGSIISLVGSLVVPTLAITAYTTMWWHDNYKFKTAEERREPRIRFQLFLNAICFLVGVFLTGAGTYGAVMDLIVSSADTKPWTCKDNSNSV